MTTTTDQGAYDWASDDGWADRRDDWEQTSPRQPRQETPRQQGPTRHTHKEKTYNVNVGVGGSGNGARGGGAAAAADDGRHQGDRLIHAVERIEFRSEKDILALAKAINHLGRELHLILGMRAEELQGVLSQYQGKWFYFGAGSRVKARLVAAHLKVSAEAAKALGVGALKMAHSFDRHFVKPEREARQKAAGKTARKAFTIGDE